MSLLVKPRYTRSCVCSVPALKPSPTKQKSRVSGVAAPWGCGTVLWAVMTQVFGATPGVVLSINIVISQKKGELARPTSTPLRSASLLECLKLGGNGDFHNQIPTFKHSLLLLQKRSFARLLRTQKGLRTRNSHKERQKGRVECLLTPLPRAWP